jgi:hypothetical protein
MARSTNPTARIISEVSARISQATNEAPAALSQAQEALAKADLDSKISSLAGEIQAGASAVGAQIAGMPAQLGGALSQAQSLTQNIAGAVTTASEAAGSISNIGSRIAEGVNALTGGAASSGGLGSNLAALAGQVSAAAGAINNFLSLARGANIPSGAELFSQIAKVTVTPANGKDWRVRLNCDFKTLFGSPLFEKLTATKGVVWPYLPNITVTTKANYSQVDPVHSNYPFQSYKNSAVEDITISGEFSAENSSDGLYWLAATTFLRAATKMYYGRGAFEGNPPVICTLTGYGSYVFNSVPVVIKSFTVDLKEDTNYVKVSYGGSDTWVPILSTISVTVSPIYNRESLRKFNLQEFTSGKLQGFI